MLPLRVLLLGDLGLHVLLLLVLLSNLLLLQQLESNSGFGGRMGFDFPHLLRVELVVPVLLRYLDLGTMTGLCLLSLLSGVYLLEPVLLRKFDFVPLTGSFFLLVLMSLKQLLLVNLLLTMPFGKLGLGSLSRLGLEELMLFLLMLILSALRISGSDRLLDLPILVAQPLRDFCLHLLASLEVGLR